MARTFATSALRWSALTWTSLAVCGQLFFALYILALYGRSALIGNWDAWNSAMPKGIIPGDGIGNAAIASHLLVAFLLMAGGALQLIPQLRTRAPQLHRWNGRLYITSAFVASLGGLYIVWVRGSVGGLWQHIAITLNAILLLLAATFALRNARNRQFQLHRQWALRLFLLSGGVWFFRIGLMFWLAVNQGPVGFDPKTFTGPALITLTFAQSLLPLALLELYFAANRSTSPALRLTTASLLALATPATLLGLAVATKALWLPRML